MAQFRREYYLVGGTAIALHIGHRRSVDFDMFKPTEINHKRNLDRIVASGFEYQVTRRVFEQMNLIVGDVKLTFFQYPFPVASEDMFGNVFRMPSLLSLAAMKAYALGRRSKWKDYVDLYFLLTQHFQVSDRKSHCHLRRLVFGEAVSRTALVFCRYRLYRRSGIPCRSTTIQRRNKGKVDANCA